MIVYQLLALYAITADQCPPLPLEIQEIARKFPYPYEDVCMERWHDSSGLPFFRLRSSNWNGPTHPWKGEVSAWVIKDLEQYSHFLSETKWRRWFDQSTPWLLALGSLYLSIELFTPKFYQSR